MILDFRTMNNTPNSNRLHITLFGRRNSGKSSLINAITGQDISLVSNQAGTTTDIVLKSMELSPIGACLFIDTPGFDDEGEVGELRVERTLKAVERSDVALLLFDSDDFEQESIWFEQLKGRNIPIVTILNKCDIRQNIEDLSKKIESRLGVKPLCLSAKEGVEIEGLREAILSAMPADFTDHSITGELVEEGDLVMLVMPQDIQAPKGRLILPQVQTMRELLDKRAIVMSCTTDKIESTLESLVKSPKLIITDSQVFDRVYKLKPEDSMLTSFSVLMAGYKGDVASFVEGARAIENLNQGSRVLIAEACTHAPLTEDSGRVKLPRILRSRFGEGLAIDIVAGGNFPSDLTPYDLVIHCGGCMFNRKYMLNRQLKAQHHNVPMTNYGVAIAYLNGILDKIVTTDRSLSSQL